MDRAHLCPSCDAVTIFTADATYPRRCAHCFGLLRVAPVTDVLMHGMPGEHELDEFVLELGPQSVQAAPY